MYKDDNNNNIHKGENDIPLNKIIIKFLHRKFDFNVLYTLFMLFSSDRINFTYGYLLI